MVNNINSNTKRSVSLINRSADLFNQMGLGYDTTFSIKYPLVIIRMNSLGMMMGHKLFDTDSPVDDLLQNYKRMTELMKRLNKCFTEMDLVQMHLSFVLGALSVSIKSEDFKNKDDMQKITMSRMKQIDDLVDWHRA